MIKSKVFTKVLSLLLILVMVLSLTACGTKDASTAGTVTGDAEVLAEYNETRAAEVYGSFASEVEELYKEEHAELNKENNVSNVYGITYLSWTYFEYATAKEMEKDACARAYMGYIGDLLGVQMGEISEEKLEEVKEALGKALKKNEELSIKEIVLYYYASQEAENSTAE